MICGVIQKHKGCFDCIAIENALLLDMFRSLDNGLEWAKLGAGRQAKASPVLTRCMKLPCLDASIQRGVAT
jgi:hypothetical protein